MSTIIAFLVGVACGYGGANWRKAKDLVKSIMARIKSTQDTE